MKRILLAWLLFIIHFRVLPCSACESSFPTKAGASKLSAQEKQLKNVCSIIIESRNKSDYIPNQEVHHVFRLRTLKRAKGVYGGGDLLRPRKVRNGACSLLLKPFKHLAVGILLVFVIFP